MLTGNRELGAEGVAAIAKAVNSCLTLRVLKLTGELHIQQHWILCDSWGTVVWQPSRHVRLVALLCITVPSQPRTSLPMPTASSH